jgi:hypothetical protein
VSSIRERNQQIVQTLKRGASRADVAQQFGLSLSRIGFIAQEIQAEESLNQKRVVMRAELRKADDPDKLWPIQDLMDALELSAIFRLRLRNHFEAISKKEMSLRELMRVAYRLHDCSSLTAYSESLIYGVGKYGKRRLVQQIEELELGPHCSSEREKLRVVQRA